MADKFEFDPYSHAIHDDPYPHYKNLRDNDPVYFNEQHGFWLLTKYDDVFAAFRDFKTFSNSKGVALEADMGESPYPMVLTQDPPNHTKLRKIVSASMLPQHLKASEPYIREKTRALLEPFRDTGKIDLLSDFACYLPMSVIARMIQLPESDENLIRDLVDNVVLREDGNFGISERSINAYLELAGYFDQFAKDKAKSCDTGDDLLSIMLQAEKSGQMTHNEVVGFLILLGVAGNETTTKLIGNMTYRLWQNPAERKKAVDDLSIMNNVVEETMRFDGSSQILGRTVTTDVEIRGKVLKAGDRVGLCAISANRDEEKFDNPDVYDVMRKTNGHLGFGAGIHACLGSNLARLEARVAFEEILQMMPEYELDESGLERTHNPNVRGFTHVPLSF